jgi:hypothetical protein
MSFAAAHESKRVRHTCQSCRDRRARFQYRGAVRADRDHALCFECYRSELNRHRAQRLAQVSSPAALRSPFFIQREGKLLTEAQITHRRRMFVHLQLGTGK